MKCGIVLLSFHSTAQILAQVRVFAAYASISDIVIVDNAACDEDFAALRTAETLSPKVHLIRATANRGYAAGNNLGLRYLIEERGCELVAIVNPDILFGEELVQRVAQVFQTQEAYGALTGWQTRKDGALGDHPFWNAPTFGMLVQRLAFRSFLPKEVLRYQMDERVPQLMQVDAIEGCLMFLRSEALRAVGYLDEHTFLYMEEDILCTRLRRAGWRVGVLKDVPFLHDHVQATTNALSFLRMHRIYAASSEYYAKAILGLGILPRLLLRFFYYWSITVHFLYQPVKRVWRFFLRRDG